MRVKNSLETLEAQLPSRPKYDQTPLHGPLLPYYEHIETSLVMDSHRMYDEAFYWTLDQTFHLLYLMRTPRPAAPLKVDHRGLFS